MTHYLFTDGSYSPTSHTSSIGGYLLDGNKHVIFEFSEKILDKAFLKYHELAALKYGLTQALSHNITHLVCYSDDISLRNLNYLEVVNDKYIIDPVKKNLLEELIHLRTQFDLIEFKHIRRNFNKKADKLAQRSQLEHFYDNIVFQERYQIESTKLLNIPNLVCLEDYYGPSSTKEDINNFQQIVDNKFAHCQLYYLLELKTIDEDNAMAELYSIDKNTQERHFIALREFETKKVNSHCLDLLEIGFKSMKLEPKPTVGLMIVNDNLALKKFDMLLRKRFLFPKLKTPLADRFLESCSYLAEIVLIDTIPQFLISKPKAKLK